MEYLTSGINSETTDWAPGSPFWCEEHTFSHLLIAP